MDLQNYKIELIGESEIKIPEFHITYDAIEGNTIIQSIDSTFTEFIKDFTKEQQLEAMYEIINKLIQIKINS